MTRVCAHGTVEIFSGFEKEEKTGMQIRASSMGKTRLLQARDRVFCIPLLLSDKIALGIVQWGVSFASVPPNKRCAVGVGSTHPHA